MAKIIDIIFGPLDGIQKLFRRLVKFIICMMVAFLLHDQLTVYLTRINSDYLVELAEKQKAANALLAPFGSRLEFCVETQPNSDGTTEFPACTLIGSSLTVVGFRVQKDGEKEREFSSILSKHYFLPPGVANPSVEHSLHSVMRTIEGHALVPQSKIKPSSKAELCAGTARKLTDAQCGVSDEIETHLAIILQKNIIGGYRMATLFVGSIQFLTITIFLLAILEAAGRYLRWVAPKPTLVSEQAVRTGKVGESEIHYDENELRNYRESRVRAIEDRLIYRALATEARVSTSEKLGTTEPPDRLAFSNAARTSLADYLSFMRQESESTLESLHTTNEVMLKLAFAGTILGIGDALFAARNLDVADPVGKVLVKAEMFGGIGTAFGTTLLGVILSMLLSVILQAVSSSWSSRMERSYEYAIALADSVATLEQTKRKTILASFIKPAPILSAGRGGNLLLRALLTIGGGVIILLIIGSYFVLFRKELLATLPSLPW
ncbi:MotA/TolQ/ExbB proton channel family protein [Enterovibrio coralii]|uniref:Uncharacterized protein n=1 Tax=Enterovibrio coralii TaxID=294935 RepID=A0A135IBX7_9GAMM|nr:MotA/TolQ/ExbB proton channel family protein [Enterovibrio coralii]KXF82971.1 hypothetical protein ATN88_04255 [Enterovibrio coralii]